MTHTQEVKVGNETMEVNQDYLNFDGSFKDKEFEQALIAFNEKVKDALEAQSQF